MLGLILLALALPKNQPERTEIFLISLVYIMVGLYSSPRQRLGITISCSRELLPWLRSIKIA